MKIVLHAPLWIGSFEGIVDVAFSYKALAMEAVVGPPLWLHKQ